MAESTEPQTVAVEDPFDLGDTSALPLSPPQATPSVAAASPEPAVMQPAPALPPRDEQGRFTKPAYLVAQAQEMGLSDEEIADLTGEQLTRQLLRLNRHSAQIQSQYLTQRTMQDGQVRAPQPAAPVQDEFDLGLDPAKYDEAYIADMRRMFEPFKKKITTLEGELGQYRQREQQRDIRTTQQILDDAFSALPADVQKNFGVGPVDGLPTGGKEVQRRIAVVRASGLDLAKIPTMTPGQVKKAIADQAQLLYDAPAPAASDAGAYAAATEPAPAAAVKPTNGKRITQEQWNAAAVAKPTQRRGAPEPKGEELAVANLTRKMQDEGGTIPDSEELEGFLE